MDFRLLGPVEVRVDGCAVRLGHARQRSVLAVLLLEAGAPVPVRTIMDRVWGHAPPETGLNVIYGYVAKLRKVLRPHGVDLARRSGGYVLDVPADAVDVHRFRHLLAAAHARAGLPGRSGAAVTASRYERALAEWPGGRPFTDVDSPWLESVRRTLCELRLGAVLDRNDAWLRLGRSAGLAEELRELVAERPTDERPVRQLMLALHLSGRPGEALAEYRRVRDRLADGLGIDPSPELADLHRRILAREEAPVAAS